MSRPERIERPPLLFPIEIIDKREFPKPRNPVKQVEYKPTAESLNERLEFAIWELSHDVASGQPGGFWKDPKEAEEFTTDDKESIQTIFEDADKLKLKLNPEIVLQAASLLEKFEN